MLRNKFITIQATFPEEDHYAQWIKEKLGLCYYMDVFSERGDHTTQVFHW